MREKFPLKETRSVLYSSVLETGVEEVVEGEGVRIKFTLSFYRALYRTNTHSRYKTLLLSITCLENNDQELVGTTALGQPLTLILRDCFLNSNLLMYKRTICGERVGFPFFI